MGSHRVRGFMTAVMIPLVSLPWPKAESRENTWQGF